MKAVTKTNNPTPIKLGKNKAILQMEAAENDRSLHYWVNKIVDDYLKAKYGSVKLDLMRR